MDAYEATKVVFARVQGLVDADLASKIMGMLLTQDKSEEDMIRLAFGPEHLLQSVVADLAAADAIPNLLFALAAGAPVVVLHAAFRVRDDLEPVASADSAGGEEATGVVVEKKEDGDMETGPTRRSATAAAKS